MENKLPEGWKITNLEYICNLVTDGTHDKTPLVDKEIGVPLVTSKDLTEDGISFENVTYITTEQHQQIIRRSKPEKGDILYSKIGTIGKPTIVNVDFEFSIKNVALFKLKEDIVFNKYIRYYLKCEQVHNSLLKRADGGNQKFIPINALKKIEIILPPLKTQQKIVSILEKAEETRKLRAQADELTQKLLQSVFLEIFGDPVTNPMGWNTEKLEKLCVKIYGGGTPSKSKPEYYEGDIPWVTPKDMKQDFIQDSIDHISEKAIEESSTKLIPPYSLLMVIRSGILKHTLPIAINNCKVTMNQDMKGFVFDDKLTNSFFMLYYFKIYQRDLLNRVRSVTADNLEFSQIKDIDVILPPIKQQQRFTTIVEQLDRTRSNQQQSSLEINSLFDALMQKAFTGKLVS
ncbi:restriction endonuclease subunit S [Methanosarcina mazei]|jgi:type I restriction enzyme S subunit|uniref:Restriction endonuclease subunit S n=3 Tax=Methanosarcina mazei TaxID=2209 RepID=A0A0F8BIQ5_METMZ|nr:restriction endonuclease subunit S [Methanosarcina mazei]AKB64737.1 Type I restriction-modification system, specificity subunit S [Methanosarcina mazei S-6]AKB72781.1 Type I restriction-modification system, specificity subunit S [Methanosarcina mazei C16]KKG00595.1 hypothetical protein DU40_12700 [Methanosarcina mazei]KKG03422.1 hypothetical protein DU47_12535 [Methanosarcina mazei]KKG07168.1 hypothetical protein DU31_13085 [Methanosarcina mazei]